MNHQKLPPILEPGDRLGGAVITGYGGCHHPWIIESFEGLNSRHGVQAEQVSFDNAGFELICATKEDADRAREVLLAYGRNGVTWAESGVFANTGRGWVHGNLEISPWYGDAQTIAWLKSLKPQPEPTVEPISSFKSSVDGSTQTTQMVYTIPIIDRQNNVPVVQVTINGYKCEMLLDSGCSLMALPRDVIKAIRPRQVGTATASTASGQHQTKVYELDTVQAGNLTVKGVQASALKNGDRGLLGHSFWGDRPITIKADVVEIGESTYDFLARKASENAEGFGRTADCLDEGYRKEKDPQEAHRKRQEARRVRKHQRRAEERSKRFAERSKEAEPVVDTRDKRSSGNRRRVVRLKPKDSKPSTTLNKLQRDDYTDRQEAIHRGTAKAASYLHLAGGAFLGVAQTCFRRTFLSFVAAFALIGGMILASIGYAISLGFMPQSLFPDGQSIGQLYQGLVEWFATAQPWQLWGCAIAAFLAVVVQCFQSWSIYTIQSGVAASKAGGKSIFSNRLHRFLFYIVAGLVWYLDFETISGVSFAAGVAGFSLWLWAAFPSEIAAMILQIQKSAKDD